MLPQLQLNYVACLENRKKGHTIRNTVPANTSLDLACDGTNPISSVGVQPGEPTNDSFLVNNSLRAKETK